MSTPPTWKPRPRTAAEFREHVLSPGEPEKPLVPPGFEFGEGDVVITTYPKCGTTWVQQIVHGLRTDGSMDFEEISLVVPWIESAPYLGIDLDAPQVASPRVFKAHLPRHVLPAASRTIFIARDPGDALVSFYHFTNGVDFERDAITIEEFAAVAFFADRPRGRYWEHVRSWWSVRERDDVLFLCFEDMKEDLRPIVVRIAEFCGIEADDGLIDLVTRQASFEFMRAHESQFDDHPTIDAFSELFGFAPARTTKVRAGRVGDRKKELPPALVELLERTWQEEIAGPLGIGSYHELREALRG